MRYVTFRGNQYPIRDSVTVEQALQERLDAIVAPAVENAQKAAEAQELDEEATEDLVKKARADAVHRYVYDTKNNLLQFADMINAAVDYARVIEGRDISAEIVGGYPMTGEKLAFLATAADLNNEANVQAVAEEFADGRGSAEKKLKAGELVRLAKTMAAKI